MTYAPEMDMGQINYAASGRHEAMAYTALSQQFAAQAQIMPQETNLGARYALIAPTLTEVGKGRYDLKGDSDLLKAMESVKYGIGRAPIAEKMGFKSDIVLPNTFRIPTQRTGNQGHLNNLLH